MLDDDCKNDSLTDLSDWINGANSVQQAKLRPVCDFNWFQQELAPPVVAVFTHNPTAKEETQLEFVTLL